MKVYLGAIFAAAFAFGFFSDARAAGDLYFRSYIRGSDLSVDKDPINVAYTVNGNITRAVNEFVYHVQWYDEGGSPMYFQDHGVWEEHQAQKASWCLACTRDHTRFNEQNDAAPSPWGTFTMGPAHYEIITFCGHSSRSFNDARTRIVNAFSSAPDHPISWVYWGNTAASQQCDGVWTSGDGWIARIEQQ